MAEVKHEWLPRTIMSDHFAETWEEYMKAYADCRPEVFMNAAQREVNSRIKRRDLK
jgi:putative aldouronate transport system substrate-binding protein